MLLALDIVSLLAFAAPALFVAWQAFEASRDCKPEHSKIYIGAGAVLLILVLIIATAGGRVIAGLLKKHLKKRDQIVFATFCCLLAIIEDVAAHA